MPGGQGRLVPAFPGDLAGALVEEVKGVPGVGDLLADAGPGHRPEELGRNSGTGHGGAGSGDGRPFGGLVSGRPGAGSRAAGQALDDRRRAPITGGPVAGEKVGRITGELAEPTINIVPKEPCRVVMTVPVVFAAADAGALPSRGLTPIPAATIASEIAVFLRASRRTAVTIYPPVVDWPFMAVICQLNRRARAAKGGWPVYRRVLARHFFVPSTTPKLGARALIPSAAPAPWACGPRADRGWRR